MIRSMTGFGRAEVSSGGWRCGVEARSVNSRFLEVRFKLPPGLAQMEEPLRQVIKKKCDRGKFECTFTLTPEDPETAGLELNRPLLAQYTALLGALKENLGVEIQVTLGNLTNIKDLILAENWEHHGEEIRPLLEEALTQATDGLVEMRRQEGYAIKAELEQRVAAIRDFLDEIIPMTANIPDRYAERLRESLKRLADDATFNEDRIYQEIAILADRYDVSEELSRFQTHLNHLEGMLQNGGSFGRKFDFLLQEVNREANTLAAKSNDADISARVVEIKSELEKLREQIQNIE